MAPAWLSLRRRSQGESEVWSVAIVDVISSFKNAHSVLFRAAHQHSWVVNKTRRCRIRALHGYIVPGFHVLCEHPRTFDLGRLLKFRCVDAVIKEGTPPFLTLLLRLTPSLERRAYVG